MKRRDAGSFAQPGCIGRGAGLSQASIQPAAVALPGVRQFGAPSEGGRRAAAGGAEWRGLSRPGLGSPVAVRSYVRTPRQSTASAEPGCAVHFAGQA